MCGRVRDKNVDAMEVKWSVCGCIQAGGEREREGGGRRGRRKRCESNWQGGIGVRERRKWRDRDRDREIRMLRSECKPLSGLFQLVAQCDD